MFDFPAPATPGQIFEPNGAGTQPAYTFNGSAWDYGATTELLISSVIPNSAICGSAALPAVRALGYNFTATTQVLIDGVAVATNFVSVSELTFPVNPVPETVPRTAVITVQDGATVGVGAVPFAFNIVTTYIWNIGIDETTPGTIDVRVANTNAEIGGVTVTPRDATTQGLALDLVTGALAAPLATPLLAGVLTEPPDDSRGYVRQTTGASSTWVPPADTPLPAFRIGLDDVTLLGTVDLQIANTVGEIGGVLTEPRTAIQGLDMAVTGLITVPLATPLLAGAIVEPPPDAKGYVRTTQTTGVSQWVPPAAAVLPDYGLGLSLDQAAVPPMVNLQPAGDSPATLGGVYVIDRVRNNTEGLELGIDGRLRVPPATDSLLGGILEPPLDDRGYVRTYKGGVGAWVPPADPAPAPLAVEFIIPNTAPVGSPLLTVEVHGTKFTSTCSVIVDGAAKATTYVSPTELTFQIDPSIEIVRIARVTVQDSVGPVNGIGDAPFFFVAPTSLYRGTYSPVNNTPDIWATRQLGFMWVVDLVDPMVPEFSGVPGLAGLALNEGDHLVYDGTQYNLVDGNQTASLYQGWWKVAGNVPDIGAMVKYTGYMWIADTAVPNTPETPPAGLPGLAGVAIYEGDMILWDGAKFVLMQGVLTPNYRGLWNVASNTPPIDQPPVGNNKPNWMWLAKTVDPKVPETAPATIPGIGGKTIAEGDHIVWDKPNGVFIQITSAGDVLEYRVGLLDQRPGGQNIIDLKYAGQNGEIGGVKVIGRSPTQGLEFNQSTHVLTAPLATHVVAGAIVDPPDDGQVYARSRTAGVSAWVPSVAGVFIGDDPPPAPTVGMLWFESDTGHMHIWYTDINSSQWVQF